MIGKIEMFVDSAGGINKTEKEAAEKNASIRRVAAKANLQSFVKNKPDGSYDWYDYRAEKGFNDGKSHVFSAIYDRPREFLAALTVYIEEIEKAERGYGK